MDSRDVVIVTGANSGIGKATAHALAVTGARVVLACRSLARGEAALEDISRATGSDRVELMHLGLSSLESARSFASAFLRRHDRLSCLINNAGVILRDRQLSADGYEMQFAVNHLGHFLLTRELLPVLQASAPSRVVTVSSGAHRIRRIDFDDINLDRRYTIFGAYARSKLANILFTRELARRTAGSGVTANCLHPGGVGTNIGVDRVTRAGSRIMQVLSAIMASPEKGAETSVYLATAPEVATVTGAYFVKQRPRTPARRALDDEAPRSAGAGEPAMGGA
ncbi:MAG: SDR family oxidoreductase [bacterium]